MEIGPGYADVYNKRGGAWVHKGELDKALADYTKAVESDPEFEDAYYNRAVVRTRKGEFAEALADYTEALERNGQYGDAYNQMARILAMSPDVQYRDGTKAVEYAEKALKIRLKPSYLDTMAAAHAEQGSFEEAVKAQEKAIKLLREKGGTQKHLSAYRERLNAYKARKTWRQTLAKEHYDLTGDFGREEAPAAGKASSQKIFSLQVGAFKSLKNAEKMTARLKKKGYDVWTVPMTYSGGEVLQTVLCGRYGTLAEAKEAAAAIKETENISPSIREVEPP